MVVIKIMDSDPSNGNLTLSDRGHSNAKRGEKVKWIIQPQSGVKSITGITVKPESTNVFDPVPAPVGSSSNWQGTVKTALTIPAVEDYNIVWTDNAGNEYTFDPQIRVNR